jgi:hypothetical protein
MPSLNLFISPNISLSMSVYGPDVTRLVAKHVINRSGASHDVPVVVLKIKVRVAGLGWLAAVNVEPTIDGAAGDKHSCSRPVVSHSTVKSSPPWHSEMDGVYSI